MSTQLITNALVAMADEIVLGTVELHEGRFTDVQPGITSLAAAEDWRGDYLIPGLVELHTDNLEKQLEPRPGVRWPALPALLIHDALISSAGITTVLDAMGVGDFDENSVRAQGLAGRYPGAAARAPARSCCAPSICCTCAARSRATTCSRW